MWNTAQVGYQQDLTTNDRDVIGYDMDTIRYAMDTIGYNGNNAKNSEPSGLSLLGGAGGREITRWLGTTGLVPQGQLRGDMEIAKMI